MKSRILAAAFFALSLGVSAQHGQFENKFSRPLCDVLHDIETRFSIRLKYNVDTAGLVLPYADYRVRPYSLEESLKNILGYFDFVAVKQNDKLYKIKHYEYARRTAADGRRMTDYLNTLYTDKAAWEQRKDTLRRQIRVNLGIDPLLAKRVESKPVLSKLRKYDGYTVQNFYLETLPGVYVCGSIYAPRSKGKHPMIVCPNGHFNQGRYRKDQQERLGSLARMGAICVDYDLVGWGESELQVGKQGHQQSVAHTLQALNGLSILDFMIKRKDVDTSRIGVNGGSGGGSQTILLTALDSRFTAACPVVSLSSHFDGGCPCESGMPVSLSCGGTNNAELMAMFAPAPLMVVSDGKDWTASVPEIELPYLQRIYGFYNAQPSLMNVHLPKEGHDFGPNKRNAVYDFFIKAFSLDASKLDESKITIEPVEAMLAWGKDGKDMPENAVRSIDELLKAAD